MGCHTWYYRHNKSVKSLNKHTLRDEGVKSASEWYWDNLDRENNEYSIELALQSVGINLEYDDFINLSKSNLTEYNRIIYLIDDKVNKEIESLRDPKCKYSYLLDNYITIEFMKDDYWSVSTVYKNKIYSEIGVNGDNIFRIYGYPERNPIRSYKAFRRLIINSYLNGRLPEDKRKDNYGVTYKLPTKGEWKTIRRYCKGDFILKFG